MNIIFLALVAAAILAIKHLYVWSPTDPGRHYQNRPVFFAHRGLLHLAPENTSASFQAAIEKGFSAVEYDVVGSADGQVVCSHNFDLERKTDGKGWITDLEWKDIESLKTGSGKLRTQMTLFENALILFSEQVLQNIEIKTSKVFDLRTAKHVVALIRKHKKTDNVIVSSFNPFTIWYIKLIAPEIRTGFILETMEYFFMVNLIHPDFLHPSIDILSKNLIKFARDRNLGLNVWTVNNQQAVQYLLDRGVDGIITDRHELHPDRTTYLTQEYRPKINQIPLPEIRKIRHEVLRAGLRYSTTLWEDDKKPGIMHFGLVQGNQTLSIVSYFKKNSDIVKGKSGVQLRGMATRPEHQGRGYGTTLLKGTLEIIRNTGGADFVWANIRLTAASFYEKNGFVFISEEFVVPEIGPHKIGMLSLN